MIVSKQDAAEDMPKERDAHFLHEKSAFEPVLCPPIDRPRAITWIGKTAKLLCATEVGEIVEIDPVFGTRTLDTHVNDPALISVSPSGKRVVVVERGRGVTLLAPTGDRIKSIRCELLSDIQLAWFTRTDGRGALAVVGDTLDGRKALLIEKDFSRHRTARIPQQTTVGAGRGGKLLAARCCTDGLDVVSFGKPMKKSIPSRHRLRFGGGGVLLGMAEGGVTIWRNHKQSNTVMVYDVTAAAVSDNGMVAIGTREGDVAFCNIDGDIVGRAHPDRVGGHTGAVREMAFSKKARWLATSADSLWLWRY
ncbi:MAG TPA: hypothetical protein QGF58_21265 [Myxococcota bacterium]|nr:hypothetical protein [Myxococcota bacterium]